MKSVSVDFKKCSPSTIRNMPIHYTIFTILHLLILINNSYPNHRHHSHNHNLRFQMKKSKCHQQNQVEDEQHRDQTDPLQAMSSFP